MRKMFLPALLSMLSLAVAVSAQQDSLVADSSLQLNELVVSSLRVTDKSPVAHSTVTKKELSSINLGQDIPMLLSMTPSYVANSDAGTGVGYTGFRIRGTDANRINITVNGIPLNDSESHGVFWVNMPDFASSIENIQIQRGVGTSTNGAGAFGATINMRTEALNKEAYGEISSSYGSFNTNKNTLKLGTGLLKNKFAFDARLSSLSSDGYIDRASADLKSYYFAGGYYGKKTLVKAVTFGGSEKTYHAWYGVPGDSLKTNRTYNLCGEYLDSAGVAHYYKDQTDNYKQTHYQLFLSHKFNTRWNVNAALHYTRGIGFYEEYKNGWYQEGEKLASYGLSPIINGSDTLMVTQLIRQKWLDNHFYGMVFSLNYTSSKLDASLGGGVNEYDGQHFGYVKWMKDASEAVHNYEYYRSKSVKIDANIYAKANYQLAKGLNIYGDLQYRYINHRMDGISDKLQVLDLNPIFKFFNPKGGIHYAVNKNNSVYASYSIANREPTRTNYTESSVYEKPTSEQLSDVEMGYLFKNKNFSLGVNLYYMNYKNQLILTGKVSEIGELLTTNIPKSKREGIELMIGYKIAKWLSWEGNFTYSRNKIINFAEVVDSLDVNWNWISTTEVNLGNTDIAYSPNITAASMFTFTIKGFQASLQSNYVGKQYIDNTSSEERKINSYFVNNLRMSYALKLKGIKEIDFNLAINNLFGEVYENNGYVWYSCYLDGERNNDLRFFPQAGRNILAGITLKF